MFIRSTHIVATFLSAALLAACGGNDYQPAASTATPVDTSEFVPAVDAFVVLLDTSGSMADGDWRHKQRSGSARFGSES